jgi:hypothetical protein
MIETDYKPFIAENANILNERRLSKDKDGNVIGNIVSPTSTGIMDLNTTFLPQSTAAVLPSTVPLTAAQRTQELRRNVEEYRRVIKAVNDAVAKNLADALLDLISKELATVLIEINKISNSTTLTPPQQGPFYPGPHQPVYPSIGDGIKWYADNPSKPGISYTADMSASHPVFLTNNDEENM